MRAAVRSSSIFHLVAPLLMIGPGLACGDGGTGPGNDDAGVTIGPIPAGLAGKVAFVTVHHPAEQSSESRLHVVTMAEQVDRVIYTVRDKFIEGITWAPDGEHLVVQTFQLHWSDDITEIYSTHELRRIDLAGTEDRLLFNHTDPEVHPAYAPDGRLAYFAIGRDGEDSGIYIDGQFFHPMDWDLSCSLAWVPDGSAVVYAGYEGLMRVSLGDGALTRLIPTDDGATIHGPSVSQPGTQVVYSRWNSASQEESIWHAAIDGSQQRRLTDGPADGLPVWTPGGVFIAFLRSGGIYVVSPEGGTPQRVIGVGAVPTGPMTWTR